MVTGIRELRNITGLSQKEFGNKYNIPLKTIQNWESDRSKEASRSCPPYVIYLLAKAVATDYSDCKLQDKLDNLVAHGKLFLDIKRESAIRYALKMISQSKLFPYVEDVILYGSTARNEASSSSDIDLLLVLNPHAKEQENSRSWIVDLRGNISTDNIRDPEADLHIAYGDSWKSGNQAYQRNIQKEGLSIWN